MMIFLKRLMNRVQSVQLFASKLAVGNWFDTIKLAAVAVIASICFVSLGASAQAADIDYSKNSEGAIQSTERYDNIQSKQGGMNGFDAVDPRRNTNEASIKAQILSDVAKRRQVQADDPLEPVREVVDNVKDKVGDTADSVTDKTSRTVDSATDRASRTASRTVDSVREDLR